MTPAVCEIHHAQHTGGVLSRHTDYWYQAVVTVGTRSHVIAETPRRRNDRTRTAASRADLTELERTLRGDGWELVAGSIDGLARFQRPQETGSAVALGRPARWSLRGRSRMAVRRS